MQSTSLVHRYTCTIHDGEQCDGHCTVTADQLIATYAHSIAEVTEQAPATTLTDFIDQIDAASSHMYDAGIAEAEFLGNAATYLSVSTETSGDERDGLLKKARDTLTGLPILIAEYRHIA
jgi:hypothetical protein